MRMRGILSQQKVGPQETAAKMAAPSVALRVVRGLHVNFRSLASSIFPSSGLPIAIANVSEPLPARWSGSGGAGIRKPLPMGIHSTNPNQWT